MLSFRTEFLHPFIVSSGQFSPKTLAITFINVSETAIRFHFQQLENAGVIALRKPPLKRQYNMPFLPDNAAFFVNRF